MRRRALPAHGRVRARPDRPLARGALLSRICGTDAAHAMSGNKSIVTSLAPPARVRRYERHARGAEGAHDGTRHEGHPGVSRGNLAAKDGEGRRRDGTRPGERPGKAGVDGRIASRDSHVPIPLRGGQVTALRRAGPRAAGDRSGNGWVRVICVCRHSSTYMKCRRQAGETSPDPTSKLQ